MQIGLGIVAAVSGVAVYTAVLALLFGKLRWSWRVGLVLALVAMLGAGPFAGLRAYAGYNAALERAVVNALSQEHERALQDFHAQYPDAELAGASLVWLYQYTNQGTPHAVIRVGNQWVELNVQAPQATPIPAEK